MFDWRATPDERTEALPGDERIPEAAGPSTHAVTIRARPGAIWPWLLQLGCDRAGFYSYDRLDNAGRPSADRIIPELQDTVVGDILPSRPGSPHGFEVLEMDPPRLFLLGAYLLIPGFSNLPWDAARPRAYVRSTWAFVLRERREGTRLLVRTRGIIRPRWMELAINAFMDPAHVVMQRKQLLNLRARAEGMAQEGSGSSPATS